MKSYWTLANLFSLGNASCGVLSILFSLNHDYRRSVVFLLVAVLFDFLDGKTARAMNQSSTFGKALDSLSDVIAFGSAPAVLSYFMIGQVSLGSNLALTLFVLAGAWRLAFFIQWTKEYRCPGMPITFNGLIFPLLFVLHAPGQVFLGAIIMSAGVMVLPIFLSRPSVT